MRLYNFLTRKEENLKPIHKDWVGLYTCGPTVYNFAHIGNLRTYIFEDILARTLKLAFPDKEIRQVMNITDVDDKIIRDAKAARKNIYEFTAPYEKAFYEDLTKLSIQPAWKYPKATEHIPEIIDLISDLLKKGMAYESGGSVYFDLKKFKPYGRLSGLEKVELKAGARVEADEYNKEDVRDFILWKAVKPGDQEVEAVWNAPFGKGRPGWHIECSAMSMRHLEETFDIHAGAIDLLFPHHENEIAQSEGATGLPFARYFVEGEHLLVDGQKMSKSLGNFYTLRDIEVKGYDPLEFRYLVLSSHYRARLNFTWGVLNDAKTGLHNIRNNVGHLKQLIKYYDGFNFKNPSDREIDLEECWKSFQGEVNNDLSTHMAVGTLFKILTPYSGITKQSAEIALDIIQRIDKIFGLKLDKYELPPEKVVELAKERKKYRGEKKWEEGDKLRQQIEEKGWQIEDTASWFFLKKKN